VIHRFAVVLIALVVASGTIRGPLVPPVDVFHAAIEPQRAVETIGTSLPVRAGAIRAGSHVDGAPAWRVPSDCAVVPAVRLLAPAAVAFSRSDHDSPKLSSPALPGAGVRGPPSAA
jgi:hypothetical protein